MTVWVGSISHYIGRPTEIGRALLTEIKAGGASVKLGAGGLELATKLGDKLGRKDKAHITLIERSRWLIEIAHKLGVPVLASEQYPRGLGHTVPPVAEVPATARSSSWVRCR